MRQTFKIQECTYITLLFFDRHIFFIVGLIQFVCHFRTITYHSLACRNIPFDLNEDFFCGNIEIHAMIN